MSLPAGRHRFRGQIAGLGTTDGVRIVLGHWWQTPLGAFSDAMVQTADDHRVLLAPHQEAADFIAATYRFDEVRIQPFNVSEGPGEWRIASDSLTLTVRFGRRTPLGMLLRATPALVTESPLFSTAADPLVRVLLRGVRTRGSAKDGRREWYGATDNHAITAVSGAFDGQPLHVLADVKPAPTFGFSSTPSRPSVTRVVTTVEVPG